MAQKSLGLIEVVGLAAGIIAADVAVKSANVELVGYELSKGGGMTVIKIEGDVGAVKAAISAAEMAVKQKGDVVSAVVIPRPACGLDCLVRNKDTVGYKLQEPLESVDIQNQGSAKEQEIIPEAEPEKEPEPEQEIVLEAKPETEPEKESEPEVIPENEPAISEETAVTEEAELQKEDGGTNESAASSAENEPETPKEVKPRNSGRGRQKQ